jgi:hypothetical protein
MTNSKSVPVEYIHKCFEYREEVIDGVRQGNVYWKYRDDLSLKWNARFAGKKAGSINDRGYYIVEVRYNNLRCSMKLHIVVWILFENEYPVDMLDHIDQDRLNNLRENLRNADAYKNRINRKKSDKASSIYNYVSLNTDTLGSWRVRFVETKKGSRTSLFQKSFRDELEAAICANEMAPNFHPIEFINFNDISMGYSNQEYPNMPKGWVPEEMAA